MASRSFPNPWGEPHRLSMNSAVTGRRMRVWPSRWMDSLVPTASFICWRISAGIMIWPLVLRVVYSAFIMYMVGDCKIKVNDGLQYSICLTHAAEYAIVVYLHNTCYRTLHITGIAIKTSGLPGTILKPPTSPIIVTSVVPYGRAAMIRPCDPTRALWASL